MSCITCATNTARSLARLSREGGTRRGGVLADAFAGVFALAPGAVALPGPGAGAGVAGVREQESATNATPANVIPLRPAMIYLILGKGFSEKNAPA